MREKEILEDIKTRKALVDYVDKVRRIPRVRSFFWLLRCTDALNKYASMEVGKKGSNRTGIAVLQLLLKYPNGVSQQAIAKQTGRTKQAITVAIDNLEKKGHVIRASDNNDRRVNVVRLTLDGVDYLREVFPHTVAMSNEALASLNDTEVDRLLSIVKKLTKNMWQKIESQSSKNE